MSAIGLAAICAGLSSRCPKCDRQSLVRDTHFEMAVPEEYRDLVRSYLAELGWDPHDIESYMPGDLCLGLECIRCGWEARVLRSASGGSPAALLQPVARTCSRGAGRTKSAPSPLVGSGAARAHVVQARFASVCHRRHPRLTLPHLLASSILTHVRCTRSRRAARDNLRASVGSTEASASLPACFGVGGPTRAT
jgi:hypothetical protein